MKWKFNLFGKKEIKQAPPLNPIFDPFSSTFMPDSAGGWSPFPSVAFDGEKNAGEMGNVINLFPDYDSLRYRAYEAYLREDVVKSIVSKFFRFVIGNGLILKA